MTPVMKRTGLSLLIGSALLLAPGIAAEPPPKSGEDRGTGLGVAVTPKNFPRHNGADLDAAFRLAREIGGHAVFIFQWSDFDPRIVRSVVTKCRQHGLTPILGLSPTTLDQGRKEIDCPPAVRDQAGERLSFAHPAVRRGYRRAARELARLHPPYLCLATEINLLAQHPPEYLRFARLYKEAYREVKGIAPATRVFVSFQWDFARALDAREPNKLREHSRLFRIFQPELDLVGLTTYPAPHFPTPADIPMDYYASLYRHVDRKEAVLVMEVGWPSGGAGSPREQVAYIHRLPELMGPLQPAVIAWSLLHDVDHPAFDANLNTTGLLTGRSRKKPGFAAFRHLPWARRGATSRLAPASGPR